MNFLRIEVSMDYQKSILNCLVDKYERSKSFIGTNNVSQSFSVKPEQLFSGYSDDANVSLFQSVNREADELESMGYVTVKKKRGNVITSVSLVLDRLDEVYRYLHRTPKKDTNHRLTELLTSFIGKNELLDRYCKDQLARLDGNKNVKGADDFDSFRQILLVLASVFSVEEETYQRDFSVRVLGDSKAFEKIRSKVATILMEYGEFDDAETVFEDLNIVKNPGHVYFKGAGILNVNGQTIDLSQLSGDIGLSSKLLDSICSICVTGSKVITVENLTTFHSFSDANALIIYLGGYHNSIRRRFICRVFEQNSKKQYYHYGDIDAGGFYILQHLRRKTGIDFMPLLMDIKTLVQNKNQWKSLTPNDRNRLKCLENTEFGDVIRYMLEHNCKFEQESLD